MTQFEKLKTEISGMDINTFAKIFLVNDEAMKNYICSDIKVPHAQCINHREHNCVECITAYLGSVVEE